MADLSSVYEQLLDIGYKFLDMTGTEESDLDVKIAKDYALGVLDNIRLFVRTGRWSWDEASYEGWQDGDDEYQFAFKSSALLSDYKMVVGALMQLANNDNRVALQLIDQLRSDQEYFDAPADQREFAEPAPQRTPREGVDPRDIARLITENPDVPAEQSALKLLHLSDWNDTDKYYEVPVSILMSFKDKIEQVGISAAWRWFTDLVDYSIDASDQNKPVKRIDDSNNTLDNYFLGWLNPIESIAEWDL